MAADQSEYFTGSQREKPHENKVAAIAMPYGSTPGEITAGTKNNNFPPKNLSRFILLNSYVEITIFATNGCS